MHYQILQSSQVLDAPIDTGDWVGRLVLLDVAMSDTRFLSGLDDRLHGDDAATELLKRILGDANEFRKGHPLFEIL